MKKIKKINLKRYKNLLENIIFIFSLILVYVIQTSCKFRFIYDNIPISILAVTLSIAMFKDVFLSCIYSLFAGILCDMALNIPIGVSSFVFVIICTIVSLLTIYYLKSNLTSFLVFMFIFVLTEFLVANIFKLNKIYLKNIIIYIVFGYLISLPIFLFFYYVNNTLSDKDIFFTKNN